MFVSLIMACQTNEQNPPITQNENTIPTPDNVTPLNKPKVIPRQDSILKGVIKKIDKATPLKPSNFKAALESLSTLKYQYAIKDLEEVEASRALVISSIKRLNPYKERQKKPLIPEIPTKDIKTVQKAFVKGEKEISKNTYPRAGIEEWEFKSIEGAEKVELLIDKIKKEYHWDEISKSPITYWRMDNKIYFVTPGGFFMLKESGVIQDKMMEVL